MAANKTFTELEELTTVDKNNDWLAVVDVSDTTASTYGTTKKANVDQFIGEKGDAATVDAGTTTTGDAGTNASVVNVGTTSAAVLNFTIPRGNTGATGATGSDGADGDSAYVYIAYASDASGTGFTTTFNAALDYIAVKATTTEITTPQASDFTGLWKNYKGATGAQGIQGEIGLTGAAGADGTDGTDGVNAYVYIAYASDNSGTGFTTTFDANLDYVAIKTTTTEIVTPQASDFTGLWKNYKGATGLQGIQGDPGVDGEDGLDINWRGNYASGTAYVINDAVFYSGSSYICKLASTGNLPTNTTYWDLMAQQGASGEGSGDVSGPASATDNAIARFDLTTGKLIQDSLVTVDDSGSINIPSGQQYLVNGSPVEGYSDEQAQDAVGTILTDSSEIDFTYNDETPSITASLKNGSIDETKLDTSTNASLDLADSALQSITTSAPTNLTGFLKGNGTNVLASTTAVVAGTCTTARTTAAKVCNISGYTLTAGDMLAITFTDGFSVNNATLNINSGGAVNIRVGAVNVTTALISVAAATSFTLPLYYDGTHFYAYGSGLNTDTNTTYTEISEAEITAGTGTTLRSISGRRAEFLAASIKGRTETLTNKTLTSPVINTSISGTAILDEDNMASDSATKLATQQSIKAYADTKIPNSIKSGNGDSVATVDSVDIAGEYLVKFDADGNITDSGLHSANVLESIDEDNMASNLDTKVPTQQSIKAYVDSKGFTWEGAWATSTPYSVNDTVQNDGSGYVCTSAHTSGATTEPGVGASWTDKWDLFVEGIGGNSVQVDSSGGTSDTYGVLGGLVNSSNKVYTVSLGSYISGSLRVYLNGQLQTQGSSEDWTETTPASGTFTFATAPTTGDIIIVMYQFSTGSTGNADTLDGLHSSSLAVPSGSVIMYAGSSAPTGYLICDGSAVSRTTYATLFTAISTTWGVGDNSTTFNIPDMRGIFPKGAGTTSRAAGKDAKDAYYASTLGTYYTDKMQGHHHLVGHDPAANPDNFATVTAGAGWFGASGEAAPNGYVLRAKSAATDGTNGTPRVGGSTEPQSAGINYIIKT